MSVDDNPDRKDLGVWSPTHANMSLRDYFAGQALAGIRVNANTRMYSIIAIAAYEIADAMLKERAK